MVQLFDSLVRTDGSPSRNVEARFAFLNRAAGEPFDRVRALAEDWFAAYPASGQADLRERFHSNQRGEMSGAWWELYQHEVFRRLGYAIALHPEVDGTTRRPDFLIEDSTGSFYVELTFSGRSHAEDAAANRRAQVHDLVDALPVTGWWIGMTIEEDGPSPPPTRALRRDLLTWLAALDPNALLVDPDEPARHMFTWRHAGWLVEFTPIPRRSAARGSAGRTVGVYSDAPIGVIDTREPLVKAMKRKASAYGALDRPYLLAVLFEHDFIDDDDLFNALFGSISYRIPIDPASATGVVALRNQDGAWIGPNGPRHTRVSGVLTAINLLPWNVNRVTPHLWLNPWAAHPLRSHLPWLTTVGNLPTGVVEQRPAMVAPTDLFGLASDWPGDPYR